jgi:Mrp family chromosome partitioning ATPase
MGFSTALTGEWEQIKVQVEGQATDIPMLRVLTAGAPCPNPTELLQSPLASQLFDHLQKLAFDYIIFDTPPLLPVADAQILASYVQATVLVIDASKTSREALLHAKRILGRTPTMILGAVINKSQWGSKDYGNSRLYLSRMQQTQKQMTIPDTPRVESMVNTPFPATIPKDELDADSQTISPMNGVVELDHTIVLPRLQTGGDE